MRMATLAEGGRIAADQVTNEIQRLEKSWHTQPEIETDILESLLTVEQLAGLDLFDRLQLQAVITVCRECSSLSDAGRKLFAVSRNQRSAANDADRLRKYLAKFGLSWAVIKMAKSQLIVEKI